MRDGDDVIDEDSTERLHDGVPPSGPADFRAEPEAADVGQGDGSSLVRHVAGPDEDDAPAMPAGAGGMPGGAAFGLRPRLRAPASRRGEIVEDGTRVGYVHSWETSTGVDGPGPRFVLFMAGCPLRCQYCHNPDTWEMRNGRRMTVGAVRNLLRRHAAFVRAAGGGLTVSGGEPLLQSDFVADVMVEAKELGMHTALDTSGYLGDRADDRLLGALDLVLLDVKSWDRPTFRRTTGVEVEPTLRFGRRLAERGIPMWIRFVLVPGLTDDPDNIEGVAKYAASLSSVEQVEVLPYHSLGEMKYQELGLRYPLAGRRSPTAEEAQLVREIFASHGLPVR